MMLKYSETTNRKGFTLAELLVVVAIIAILIAVSIPIFTGKLNEAKESTDLANIRAAKAAAITDFLQNQEKYVPDDSSGRYTYDKYYDAKNGALKDKADGIEPYSQNVTSKDEIDPKAYILVVRIIYSKDISEPEIETEWWHPGGTTK